MKNNNNVSSNSTGSQDTTSATQTAPSTKVVVGEESGVTVSTGIKSNPNEIGDTTNNIIPITSTGGTTAVNDKNDSDKDTDTDTMTTQVNVEDTDTNVKKDATSKDGNKNDDDNDDDDDEKFQFAKAMALAIQNNPNLTTDEIHELFQTSGGSIGTGGTASAGRTHTNHYTTTNNTNNTGTNNDHGHGHSHNTTFSPKNFFTSTRQHHHQQQHHQPSSATTTSASAASKDMFKSFRDNAKKGFTDILSKSIIPPSLSSVVNAIPGSAMTTTAAAAAATSTTTTTSTTTATTTMNTTTTPTSATTTTSASASASANMNTTTLSSVQATSTVVGGKNTTTIMDNLPTISEVQLSSIEQVQSFASSISPSSSLVFDDSSSITPTIADHLMTQQQQQPITNTSATTNLTTKVANTASIVSTGTAQSSDTTLSSLTPSSAATTTQTTPVTQKSTISVPNTTTMKSPTTTTNATPTSVKPVLQSSMTASLSTIDPTTPVAANNTPTTTNNTNNNKQGGGTTAAATAATTTTLGVGGIGTDQQIRLTGIHWKRRGGFGKYKSDAWERRRIELRGTVLYYYEHCTGSGNNNNDDIASIAQSSTMDSTSTATTTTTTTSKKPTWLEQATALANFNMTLGTDGSSSTFSGGGGTVTIVSGSILSGTATGSGGDSARGYLNLVKEKAVVHASTGHSGAPSPFAISIIVKNETKWKLCFDHHAEQMRWLAAITDVVVQYSVDSYNTQLLASIDPATYHSQYPPSINTALAAAITTTTTTATHNSVFDTTSAGSIFRHPPLRQPVRNEQHGISSSASIDSTIGSGGTVGHFSRLWMMQSYNIKSLNWDDDNIMNDSNVKPSTGTSSVSTTPSVATASPTTHSGVGPTDDRHASNNDGDDNNSSSNNKDRELTLSPSTTESKDLNLLPNSLEDIVTKKKNSMDMISLVPQENWQYIAVVLNFSLWLAGAYWHVIAYSNLLTYYYMLSPLPTWTQFFELLGDAIAKTKKKKKLLSTPHTPKKLPPIHIAPKTRPSFTNSEVTVAASNVATMNLVSFEGTSSTNTDGTNDAIVDNDDNQGTMRSIKDTITTGFIPKAGSSAMQIENETDPAVNDDSDIILAGWRKLPGETLTVRSHDYQSSRRKIPSPGTLYDIAAVDVFEGPCRYPDMAPRVHLPEASFVGEDDIDNPIDKTWASPDHFVISIALPTDPPKMIGASTDGGGYTITLYFVMTQETREILKRITAEGYDPASENNKGDPDKCKVNAVRLFEEWIRRSPTDPAFQARFKIVPNAHNLKEIGIPSWISRYNGKPFLIKRSGETGFLYVHNELSCVEFDVSLHPFPYLARKGICFLKDSFFAKVVITFGFTIEGRTEDELPECVIGLVQFCHPDPQYAIQADDFFAGPLSPDSFPPTKMVLPK